MSNTTIHQQACYLGLPMWSHNHWQQSLYQDSQQAQRLAQYAQVFNTVEGNTTFYATPNIQTVQNWHDATHDAFRFTFKLPKAITHERKLHQCQAELSHFFSAMAALHERTGIWKIQLPSHFGPESLNVLADFLTQLPQDMHFGVEVRHPAFFAKGEHERDFNRLLIKHQCNRIIMDTRGVFAAPPTSAAVIDAHQKKPHVPVHPIATGQYPVVRFVGHPELVHNRQWFQNWLKLLPQWLAAGKTPYLFIHTPDNQEAPQHAIALYQALRQQIQTHYAHQLSIKNIALNPDNSQSSSQLDLGI